MFQIIGRKRTASRSGGRDRDHGRQLLLRSRLSCIAVTFGCPGIVALSLSTDPLAPPPAVEE
jgi:hypothetical protein